MLTANVLIFIFHFSAFWTSEQTLQLWERGSMHTVSCTVSLYNSCTSHIEASGWVFVFIHVCNSYCSCSVIAFSFKTMSRNKIKHVFEPHGCVRGLIRHKVCERWFILRFIFLGIDVQQTCWSKLYKLFISFHCVSHKGIKEDINKGIRVTAAAVTPVTIRLTLDSCLDLWPHCPQTQKYPLWKCWHVFLLLSLSQVHQQCTLYMYQFDMWIVKIVGQIRKEK